MRVVAAAGAAPARPPRPRAASSAATLPGCWSAAGPDRCRAVRSIRAATGKSRASAASRAGGWLRACRTPGPAGIGAQLVDQADAAPFLAQVEQHAPAGRGLRSRASAASSCGPQSHLRLPSTSPVRHSRMQPHQRRLARRLRRSPARHARAGRRGCGRRRSRRPRAPRPAAARGWRWRAAPGPSMRARSAARPPPPRRVGRARPGTRAGFRRSAPARSAAAASSGQSRCSARNGPLSGVARSSAGSASGRAAARSSGSARADQHRRVGIGRLALVGELERRRAGGRDQHRRAPRIERGERASVGGLDRQQQRRAADLDRPAVAQRVDRAPRDARAMARSERELRHQRHVVGRLLPAAACPRPPGAPSPARPGRARPTYGRAAAPGPSAASTRAIAPPGVVALRARGCSSRPRSTQPCAALNRASASNSIGVWLTTLSSALWS